MRTVTFYSYKGGVGRTLAVANFAHALARVGLRVLAVDFDLEAPGLHHKLRPRDGELSRGVVDLIHSFLSGEPPPSSLKDHVCRVSTATEGNAEIWMMPAGRLPASTYWQHLARINWHDLFFSEDPPGLGLFLELKERLLREFEPDFLLIDARTGVTELGGVATSVLADDLVCLTALNRESLEGCRTVLRSVAAAERPSPGPPVRLLPVVVRIPPDLDPAEERAKVEEARAFFNEPADDLAGTLSLERLYVLHSEPKLQLVESLMVDEIAVEPGSRLLEDYLQVLVQLLPEEISLERLKALE